MKQEKIMTDLFKKQTEVRRNILKNREIKSKTVHFEEYWTRHVRILETKSPYVHYYLVEVVDSGRSYGVKDIFCKTLERAEKVFESQSMNMPQRKRNWRNNRKTK